MKEIFKGYKEIEIHKNQIYGGYNINEIIKIINLLKNVDFNNSLEIYNILEKNGYKPIFNGISEIIHGISNKYIDTDNITEKYFLRLSEPKIDYMCNTYISSWNYADDKAENRYLRNFK